MSEAVLGAPVAAPRAPASPWGLLLRRLVRRKLVLLSLFVLLVVGVCAAGAPWLAPYAPTRMDVAHRLSAPSARHWLGSDDFGRDTLSRCMWGARLSLSCGLMVVLLSLVCGTVLGIVSGYVRRLDGLLMRVTDALMAFPDILLAIALMAALGASLFDVVIALAFVYTPRVARVARGATLVLRELQFVEASEALGASDGRVMLHHILPNLISPLLVQGTFIFAAAILTEAALSFLGAGVPPPNPTWGNMIAMAQQYMQRAEWLILAPGICIALTVLSLQMVGDGLRDALDPKLRRLT
ncbi:MAG TPA: ABC transporter permease [Acetobacteraceae bacterium]|jgi:peptide/nickel transport system permease protein|nr:ABC transporter permease [Acetobacteraceae bacterium]